MDRTTSIHEQEFTKAYNAYADAIFRHCYFRVFDRELGRELMQETFTRTWDYIRKGNGIEHMRTFLYRIANNLIIDHVRKKKETSLETLEESGFEPADISAKKLEMQIDARQIIDIIDQLGEEYREVILMRYIDGLKPKEIAELLDEKVNVVSVRITRGMKQLRALIPSPHTTPINNMKERTAVDV